MKNIVFEQSDLGTHAVIVGPWDDGMLDVLLRANINELELNQGKGWGGPGLHFLPALSHLQGLVITDMHLKSVDEVHVLRRLVRLKLMTYDNTKLHFDRFPLLKECVLEWRRGAESLFDCTTLVDLFVNRYRGTSSQPFGQLRNLRKLGILNASLHDLDGLERLSHLQSLRLANTRKIASLEPVGGLRELVSLDINTCKRISSIEPLRRLSKLRGLCLSNCGDIESLTPIDGLKELELVAFPESTNFIDGDMSVLTRLPKLKRSGYKNRKHYTHTREQIEEFWVDG